jgi:hypothetical protein
MGKLGATLMMLLCCACAATVDPSDEPREAKEYRTGSNVPVRDRGASTSTRTIDPESINDLKRRAGSRRLDTGN